MPPEDLPPPEPAKLLAFWMEWERGDATPGQAMSNLKKGGLRELLESTVAAHAEAFGTGD
jgi:hypothetical protein